MQTIQALATSALTPGTTSRGFVPPRQGPLFHNFFEKLRESKTTQGMFYSETHINPLTPVQTLLIDCLLLRKQRPKHWCASIGLPTLKATNKPQL